MDDEHWASARQQAIGQGLDTLPELSASVWQEVEAALPDLAARLRESGRNRARRDVECTVRAVVHCLATDNGTLSRRHARELRVLGTRQARRSIPVADVVDCVDLASAASFRLLASLLRAWPDATVREHVLTQMAVDAITAVRTVRREVAAGYDEHSELDGTDTGGLRTSFIGDLLLGALPEGEADPEALVETARALGLDGLEGSCALALVLPAAGRSATAMSNAVGHLIQRMGAGWAGPVHRTPTPHTALLVPLLDRAAAVTSQRFNDAVNRLPVVVFVQEVEGPEQIERTYSAMRRELPLVRAAARTPGVIVRNDLDVLRVLSDFAEPDDVLAFVRRELGAILACPPHRADELVSTLQALHDNQGNVTLTARQLGLSVPGVRERIKKIRDTSRVRLNEPTTRFRATLAVLLFRIHEPEFPAMGDRAWH